MMEINVFSCVSTIVFCITVLYNTLEIKEAMIQETGAAECRGALNSKRRKQHEKENIIDRTGGGDGSDDAVCMRKEGVIRNDCK